MSGGGKKVTVGYWYKYVQAFALSLGKLDAVLEFRAGGRTAWRGIVTESSRIYVNAKNLWGGQKKEGGLQGDMDLQLGDADQAPNDYLTAQLGADQPSYRGKSMAIWRGGIWGAMNPYPKRAEFKVRRILQGWDNDAPWYPEKAEIQLAYANFDYDQAGWKYKIEAPGSDADYSSPSYDDSGWASGPGGFGSASYGEFSVGTYVPAGTVGKGIWIRRTFDAVAGLPLNIRVAHDDGAWLWVNGQEVPISPTASYYLGTATVPGALVYPRNVIVLKVLDSIPGGSPTNIFAAIAMDQGEYELLTMNPAHVLYDSVTAKDMQGEPVALINDASFRAAADTLYEEGLGVCTSYNFDEDIEDFQQRILNVIGGALTQSREDGQYYLDLIRPTDDPESLPVITSEDIKSLSLEPSAITEQVNELVAEWYDVENNTKKSTPPMQSRGAVHAAGQVVSETVKYPEIVVEQLALRLCARDLGAKSTPLMKVTATINRRGDLWKLRPGKKVRLQAPEDGVADMTIVVGDIDYGTLKDGWIKIKGVQDVYSMPATTYVQSEVSQTPTLYAPPVAPPAQRLIEAPYVEVAANLAAADLAAFPEDAGAIMAMAAEPSNGLNYSLYSAAEGADLEDTGTGEWCPSALTVEDSGYLDNDFTLTSATGLDLVEVGSWALWDEEIVRIDAIDADALTVTLGRGCADTVPAAHAAGSRLWFCGDWGATDGLQYLDGETVSAKLLTRTTIDELALEDAALLEATMDQRWFRPYPPAGVLINDTAYPENVYGDVVLSWSHRDRVLQSDQLVDTLLPSVGPEPGTTYSVSFFVSGSHVALAVQSGISGTSASAWTPPEDGVYRVEVSATRDGLASWQPYSHEFVIGSGLGPDPYWDYVVALLRFDGDIVDETGRVWTMSGSGFVIQSDTVKFGSAAAEVTDNTSQIAANPLAGLAASEPFTLEIWVHPNSGWSGKDGAIFSQASSGAGGDQVLQIMNTSHASNPHDYPVLRYYRGTRAELSPSVSLVGSTEVILGAWNHIELGYDGVTLRTFVNGALDASVATTAGWRPTANQFLVGRSAVPGYFQYAFGFPGPLDECRLTKGVCRHTASFTPPPSPFANFGPAE